MANQNRNQFKQAKEAQLKSDDQSRKGSIDEPIQELISLINSSGNYYTTSSCSGRIIIFSPNESMNQKKGCSWLYVSHTHIDDHQDVLKPLSDLSTTLGDIYFKFEPFILHVCCDGISHAQLIHRCAMEAGFRNSGLMISKSERVMCAVRSTHSLEAPIAHDGKLIVSQEYLEFLTQLANQKLKENLNRVNKFYLNIRNELDK